MSEQIGTVVRNLARSSPSTIYISGLLVSIVTGKSLGVVFSLCALIFGGGLNFLLKMIFKMIGPEKISWMRPAPPSEGCGIFPVCTRQESITWGMPSGHSQIISFAAIFWILYLWRKAHTSRLWALTGTLIIMLVTALIMYSRILEGCHNLEQVLVGMLFGSILGGSCYFILERNKPELFD
jgi:membrane-associated phospholipid phosphatase